MQENTNIYANFPVDSRWTIISISILLALIVIKIFGPRILKAMALKKQSNIANLSDKNKISIINKAINDIQAVQNAYTNHKKSAKDASYEVSLITRTAFDTVMNHSTTKQARYESRLRKLKEIVELLDKVYKSEFSQKDDELDASAFETAIKVLKSCI